MPSGARTLGPRSSVSEITQRPKPFQDFRRDRRGLSPDGFARHDSRRDDPLEFALELLDALRMLSSEVVLLARVNSKIEELTPTLQRGNVLPFQRSYGEAASDHLRVRVRF
jgi:hypothetical protein